MLIVDRVNTYSRSLIAHLPNDEIGMIVDRTSTLGNPFYLRNVNDDVARDRVCIAYEAYFVEMKRLSGVSILQDSVGITRALISQIAGMYNVPLSSFNSLATPKTFGLAVEDIKIKYEAGTSTIRLLCWCAPRRCHADTIKAYIEGSLTIPPIDDLPASFTKPMDVVLRSMDLPTLWS